MESGPRPFRRNTPHRADDCRRADLWHRPARHRCRGHQPHLAHQPAAGPRVRGYSRSSTASPTHEGAQRRPRPYGHMRARARLGAASSEHLAIRRLKRFSCRCQFQRHHGSKRTRSLLAGRRLHRLAPMAQLRRRPRPQRRCFGAAAHRPIPGPQSRRSPCSPERRPPTRASRNQPLRPKPAHTLPRSPATARGAGRGEPTRNRRRTRLGSGELFCIRRHRKRHVPLLCSPQRSMRRKRGGKAVLYTEGRCAVRKKLRPGRSGRRHRLPRRPLRSYLRGGHLRRIRERLHPLARYVRPRRRCRRPARKLPIGLPSHWPSNAPPDASSSPVSKAAIWKPPSACACTSPASASATASAPATSSPAATCRN